MYGFKILSILLFLNIALFGNTSITKVKYEGGISLFGKVAEASVELKQDKIKHTYKIILTAFSTGIVKTLTSNRKDIFISEGDIKDGRYIPNMFTRIIRKNDYLEKTTYIFDYKKNKILKKTYTKEFIDDSSYDIIKMQRISKKKLVKLNEEKYLKLYPNDYLSMYLNLSAGKLKFGEVKYIDEKDSNKVVLLDEKSFEVIKHDGDEIYHINIIKDNSIFFDKAIAVDIAFYGDAYIKKISEKVIN